MDFSLCQDALIRENGLSREKSVRIRLMSEQVAKPGVIIREMYFEGGEVLRCYRGCFRVTLDGFGPVEIGENETIVIYPDQRVTIEALEEVNLLVYAVFEGPGVAAYFDRMGFFNGIHGPTSAQLETFREVKHCLESSDRTDQAALVLRLSDVLVTYAHDLKVGANAIVHATIRQISQNLEQGIVRLAPLYEQLHVGHTMLNQAFREVGLGSPAEYIRKEQLRQVKRLLKTTQKPIAEIASETGFISVTHFANFIKRNTGHTAREIRRGC